MKQTTESQSKQILNYLLLGCKINGLEALRLFKCFRLASRVFDIEKEFGVTVQREKIKTDSGKYICQYWIEPNQLSV